MSDLKSKWFVRIAYSVVVAFAASCLIRSMVMEIQKTENERSLAHAQLDETACHTELSHLQERLWTFYLQDVRQLGPAPLSRGPMPEAMRAMRQTLNDLKIQCQDKISKRRIKAFLEVRSGLEVNAYSLSQTLGENIAILNSND